MLRTAVVAASMILTSSNMTGAKTSDQKIDQHKTPLFTNMPSNPFIEVPFSTKDLEFLLRGPELFQTIQMPTEKIEQRTKILNGLNAGGSKVNVEDKVGTKYTLAGAPRIDGSCVILFADWQNRLLPHFVVLKQGRIIDYGGIDYYQLKTNVHLPPNILEKEITLMNIGTIMEYCDVLTKGR